MSIFTYEQIELPNNAIFKISPSQIPKFFEYPVVWYQEQVLGEKTFEGNTATVLGTAIHYIAEMYAQARINNTVIDTDKWSMDIEKSLLNLNNQQVDIAQVSSLYQPMSEQLINQYLSTNVPTEIEQQLYSHLDNGVYVAGTCDNLTVTGNSGTVVDYKNVAKKPNTDKIPWQYYIQLMAYAYMYKQQGYTIDRLRIIFTVRPTKTIGPRVFVVNHQITDKDWKAIKDVLTIIADTVTLSFDQPNLNYLLFKSMQLKD